MVKVVSFREEGEKKEDGWAEGRKERVKDNEGKKFSPPPSLLPPSRLSLLSCEGQAWRGCGLA